MTRFRTARPAVILITWHIAFHLLKRLSLDLHSIHALHGVLQLDTEAVYIRVDVCLPLQPSGREIEAAVNLFDFLRRLGRSDSAASVSRAGSAAVQPAVWQVFSSHKTGIAPA